MEKMRKIIFCAVAVIASCVLIYSCYMLISTNMEYQEAVDAYDDAVEAYVTANPEYTSDIAGSKSTIAGESETEEAVEEKTEVAPISVDFDALLEENADVVAWIYCEDTVINYPVLQTDNDKYYLSHNWNGKRNSSGAIFLSSSNTSDFTDAINYLFGHHMKNGSMFRSIQNYKEQEYYDEHPVLWLLTPQQNYKIVLFTGYVTKGDSDDYVLFSGLGYNFENYVKEVMEKSTFVPDIPDSIRLYRTPILTLSTCDYTTSNSRYVVQGYMVPAG